MRQATLSFPFNLRAASADNRDAKAVSAEVIDLTSSYETDDPGDGTPKRSVMQQEIHTLPALSPERLGSSSNSHKRPFAEHDDESADKRVRPDMNSRAILNSEISLCHHHGNKCSSQMIRCTAIKTNGQRCASRYCDSSLQMMYGRSVAQILNQGRRYHEEDSSRLKASFHDESYSWTCPKCQGDCRCSKCSKLKPKAPSMALASMLNPQPAQAGQESRHGRTFEPQLQQNRKLFTDLNRAPFKEGISGKLVQPMINFSYVVSRGEMSTRHTGAAYESLRDHQALTQAQSLSERPQRASPKQITFTKPLVEPRMVATPNMEPMTSRLPYSNLCERIWLYESLIRFDMLEVPESVLKDLDKFDSWKDKDVDVILVRLACFLASIKKLQTGSPRKPYNLLIEALRKHRAHNRRAEAWRQAREVCISQDCRIPNLEAVLTTVEQNEERVEEKEAPIPDSGDTLLDRRKRKPRRLALVVDVSEEESVTIKSDTSAGESDLSDDEEDDAAHKQPLRRSGRQAASQPRKRIVIKRKNSPQSMKNPRACSEDDEDNSGEDDKYLHEEGIEDCDFPALESRVATLSGLMDLVMRSPSITKELDEGLQRMKELEKAGKEEEREIRKEQDDELHALCAKRSDMVSVGKEDEWIAERTKLMHDHRYALVDCHMNVHVQLETLKLRSGPMGSDADGNEYWHLTNFNDVIPKDHTGRWACYLLVSGTKATLSSLIGEEEGKREKSSSSSKDEDKNEGTNANLIERAEPTSKLAQNHKDQKVFYATSSFEDIKKLINFIRYRSDLLLYQEELRERSKDEAHLVTLHARNQMQAPQSSQETSTINFMQQTPVLEDLLSVRSKGSERNSGASLSNDSNEPPAPFLEMMQQKRDQMKQELLNVQKERRARVDNVIRKLEIVREYFEWHFNEGS